MTSTPAKTTSPSDKKDVQKLQRAIIDGLEDVKAQDIQVFDTEHITSLFERVIVASGTSNRQTKALAASVRDAVRDAGFAKPRIEGEENGEWIIVDCGAAVAHIMQPTIRQYYHLEELWGDKPVKLKLGAPAPLVKAAKPEPQEKAAPAARGRAGAKTAAKTGAKAGSRAGAKPAGKPAAKPVHVQDSSYIGRVGKTNDWTAKRNASEPAAEPVAKKPRTAAKAATKLVVPASPRQPAAKAPVAKKAPAKKAATSPARSAAKPAIKPAAKKVPAKKAPARKQ